jgi:plastocyanin
VGPKLLLLIISVITMVTVSACGGGGAAPPREEKKAEETPAVKGEVRVVEVREGGVLPHFEPNLVEVKKGTTAMFRFSGLDDVTHTFTVRQLGIDLEVSAGETKESAPVTFNQVTTILFNCKFHTSVGGLGTIKVTD